MKKKCNMDRHSIHTCEKYALELESFVRTMAPVFTCVFIILIGSFDTAWSDEHSVPETSASQDSTFLNVPNRTLLTSVSVQGAEPVPADEIIPVILSREGGVLNDGLVEHDVDALTDVFHRKGWWKAQVTAEVYASILGSANLIFTVNKGSPALLGRVTIDGDGDISEWVPSQESPLYGTLFTSRLLDQTVHDIVSRLTANGYPDVMVNPSLSAHGDTVNVSLTIHPGNRALIDSIAVRGLTRTKDSIVRRELSHLIGRSAGQDVVDTAKTIIGTMDYVHRSYDPYLDYTESGICILVIGLDEGSQGSFDGVIGYQPSPEGEKGEIVGKIDLAFPNIRGTGRSSALRWENLGKNTEDIELHYTEPWIFGYPYTVSGTFAQEEREKLGYTKTVIRSSVSRDIGKLHASGGYRYEKVSSDSVSSSSAHGIDVGFSWESIDNPRNPRTGMLYSVRWTNVSKRYRFGSRDAHSLERLEFDLDHYIPTIAGQTIAVLVRYRSVTTPVGTLSLSDRYWLGGSTSIRGYREKLFPAVNALWATTEYRIIRGRASRVFVFVDTGYLTNRVKDADDRYRKKTTNRTGYGFGLRIESKAGTLGFDFGLGKGDSLGDGKLHVSLARSF